jgi:hypothetical protein
MDLQFFDEQDLEILLPVNYDGNTLTIPSTLVDDDEVTVTGNGTLNPDGSMGWTIEVVDEDGEVFNCTGSFTRE